MVDGTHPATEVAEFFTTAKAKEAFEWLSSFWTTHGMPGTLPDLDNELEAIAHSSLKAL